MKYYKIDEIVNVEPPKKYGYKAKIVKDEINNIAFYELIKSEELLEIEILKQKLVDSDYKAIKYAEGQMTIEEYEPIKVKRQNWRDRINELENILLEVYNG